MSSHDSSPVTVAAPRRPVVPRASAFWLVAAVLATAMLGTTLPSPLYVLYEQQLGFAALMTTVIFAVYAAGVLAALLLLGRASDELGRRRVLLIGLACAALSAVAFLLAQGLALLVVGRVLSGLSAGIFTATATATLVDLAGAGQGRRATVVATAANMGGLGLGPLLAGFLAQFAPLPLRLPFWVDLGLVLLAGIAVWVIPETVNVPEHPHLRIRRPGLPPEVRPVFIPAVAAGFAGFAVLGLFTAVAPSFLLELLHQPSHLLSGAVVFAVFASSALGQAVLAGRLGPRALAAGCVGLIVGMGVLIAGLAATSLPLLIVSAIITGLGQGLCMRAGLEAVNTHAPADRRAGVASVFFVVMYVGIALPVIGAGIATTLVGLQAAGIMFGLGTAATAAVALATLVPARTGTPHGHSGAGVMADPRRSTIRCAHCSTDA